ncbi:MAG: multifunctional oxoglutarate decarboxylase/oxoglutarate dehydrogenase thiamine pyrophosphate-binding subunit/dihydrolipoyllysine-residue succinyltransferase subunit [Mycobacteriales bacterium]
MTAQTGETQFGMNEWLVYEKYQQYLADPTSVDPAWTDFFADYRPQDGIGAPVASPAQPAPATAAPTPAAPTPVAPATAAPTPVAPATAAPAPAAPAAAPLPLPPPAGAATNPLKGAAARVVTNMEASLSVPTATSVRSVPAKLLEDNRVVVNRHLARSRGGKVSFTHLIGYALVQAVKDHPELNASFGTLDGKPVLVTPEHVNLGLAIDLSRPDGGRTLVVASIKAAETLDFAGFWSAYEDIVRRARTGKLTADDFADTTISLTNPGGFGTVHSIPRLMAGQGAIVGVGAMEYPAQFQGASPHTLAQLGVSKTITLTSTYDHRVIQGAQSGEFLRRMHELLLGEDGFYDAVFASLRVPYEPVRWMSDVQAVHEGDLDKGARLMELIRAYRVRGHLMADTDPLEFTIRSHPDLDIRNYGLTLWDLDREFAVGGFAAQRTMALRDVLGVLRDSYCRTVGIEYMHISDPEERSWIQERVEKRAERPDPTTQLHVLERLNAAEAFETFLHTKYVGNKRFSLEGGESTIPVLDAILTGAAQAGLDEVVIGMPHRGRLNVLANIVGKSYGQIFREFEGNIDPGTAHGSGDVKYHLGAEGTFRTADGSTVTVSLASNPSHLEAVDPVLEGVVRAKQDLINRGEDGFSVLPLLLHGDAAFAGQGVVAETLNMSQLRGYRTGGTVHVVVNNQVGFTTSPKSARSSMYASDVARMVQAPIFHVNGDDPEACVRVARLAFDFRQAFHKDVVVDLVCYRRRGHSEVDEPSFTQPLMYRTIDAKRSVRKIYMEALIGRGDITLTDAEDALRNYQEHLEKVFNETRDASSQPAPAPVMARPVTEPPQPTAVPLEVLKRIVDAQVSLPDGFTVHPRLGPQLARRPQMLDSGTVDWALGETLAFGSLLLEGHPVRLSGQDSRRGTFGQRHSVLVDYQTGAEYTPLAHLDPGQAPLFVYDSLLSEFAAMGFEYGYSVARPEALVCWEAQFGDFANGAQSIVDEFISAGEAKWGQRSGVVLLLPHGYEGQGPDHSSARIERYLALCAEDNLMVAFPSTPASYFHLLRRHAREDVHRPLIIFTPKSMLRQKAATSPTEEFTTGEFRPVLPDPAVTDPGLVTRVLLTAGKVYYDLAAERRRRQSTDVALIRVEQLYPTPAAPLAAALERFPATAQVLWVQEEPANMGAWPHLALALAEALPGGRALRLVSRRASASPAAGSATVHEAEQAALVAAAFEG